MKQWIALLLLIACLQFQVTPSFAQQIGPCPNGLEPQLTVGGFAVFADTPDMEPMLVAQGPECEDGINHWRLRIDAPVGIRPIENESIYGLEWFAETEADEYVIEPVEYEIAPGDYYEPNRFDLSEVPTTLAVGGMWQLGYSGSAMGGTTALDDGTVAVGTYRDQVIAVFPQWDDSPVTIEVFDPFGSAYGNFEVGLQDRLTQEGTVGWAELIPPNTPGLPTGVWTAVFTHHQTSIITAYELRDPGFMAVRDGSIDEQYNATMEIRELPSQGMFWTCDVVRWFFWKELDRR